MKKNDYAEKDEPLFTKSGKELLRKMKESSKGTDPSIRDTFNFRSNKTRHKLKQSVIDRTKAAASAAAAEKVSESTV